MIFDKRVLLCSTLLITLSIQLADPAFGQTINDELIVTATKIEQNIQDIGLSVNVLDREDLARLDSGEGISFLTSGLQAAVANGNQISFQIRGIGAVDHQALTPTAAATYIDGVYQATNVQAGPLLFDIDRVEVLKGPQGSLYGRNSSSGAINFHSVLPDNDAAGYVGLEYGASNKFNLNAAVNLPVNDIFSLRLAARYLTQEPLIENVQTNDEILAPKSGGGQRDEFGLRAIGRFSLSTSTEVLVYVHYSEDNGVNPAPLNDSLDIGSHRISIGPDGIQDTDNEFYGTSLVLNQEFGDLSLVSQTAYTGYNQQYGFDFDGTPAPFDVENLNANLAYNRNFDQISQEFRLNYVSKHFELMGGAYLEAEQFDQEYLIWCGELDLETLLGTCRYVGAPGRAGPLPASNGVATSLQSLISQSRKTAAIFSYNTVEITPRLSAVIGGRLTHEVIEGEGEGRHLFDDGVIALNNRDGLGQAIGRNKISDTHFSGNFGLNYAISEDAMAYISYSNGYKSGGFNGEVINNATHFSDEGLFGSESVDAFESGIKWRGHNLILNAAGFYQNYDRPQARIFVPFDTADGGSFTSNSLSNLNQAVSYGLDIEAKWAPMDDFLIKAGMTFLDTEIIQNEDPNVPQNADTFDGNPLPFASKFSGVLAARYEWQLSEKFRASISGNGKYQSSFFLDAEGRADRQQSGYEIIDASAVIHFGTGLDLGIWGRNLTNADYAISGFGFIGYNTFRGAPRTYGLSLKYSY